MVWMDTKRFYVIIRIVLLSLYCASAFEFFQFLVMNLMNCDNLPLSGNLILLAEPLCWLVVKMLRLENYILFCMNLHISYCTLFLVNFTRCSINKTAFNQQKLSLFVENSRIEFHPCLIKRDHDL